MTRTDYCVFILSHGRADNVRTYSTLRNYGYTGKIYIIIDDEDAQADQYRKNYGSQVLQFSKCDAAAVTDAGDNFPHHKSVIYARNTCRGFALTLGYKYYLVLDDDYVSFCIRHPQLHTGSHTIRKLDVVFSLILDLFTKIPAVTLCIAQGGDWIGGAKKDVMAWRRKAMNTFFCDVDRPFKFFGRVNEDVNTYITEGRKGRLFLTAMLAQVTQLPTQANSGGWTEYYLDVGTYVKSFYSVLYAPSCVQIGLMGDPHNAYKEKRIHHKINWEHAAPKILREDQRRVVHGG